MQASLADEAATYQPPTWWQLNRGIVLRHIVINIFMLAIILPLVWVLLLSIKSLPDSMRGAILAAELRLLPLRLCLREDRHLADQSLQQHLRPPGRPS